MVALLAVNLGVTLGCMLVLWLLSIRRGDPSFVDAWWPMGFVAVGWVTFGATSGDPTRRALLVGIITLWGVRLGGYLFWRWRRNGPDRRYVNMLRHAKGNPHVFTLTKVFLLQGVLQWVVSAPLQVGQRYDAPAGLQPLGWAGVALCAIGFVFEVVGDAQLVRFKTDASNEGQVLRSGLWRYTRHPNYFGDACLWWGVFLIAVVNAPTAAAVIGPCAMTFLLARWSGVPTVEARLKRHKPDYADYIARTSGFIPMPPRSAAAVAEPAGGSPR